MTDPRTTRRQFLAGSLAAALAGAALAESPATRPAPLRLYVMDNGLRGPDVPTLESKVALAAKLGYSGFDYHLDHKELPTLLDLLDKHHLELSAIYITPFIEDPIDPGLAGSIARMKGRATRLQLGIRSRKLKPSDPAGDEAAADLLKRISDVCGDSGPVVTVYPHVGFWSDRLADGLRMARRLDRKNVGTNFNLCHWWYAKPLDPLPKSLIDALPHLKTVTICGVRGREVRPLDDSEHDIAAFMAMIVKDVNYRGPFGLQCYQVPGPSGEHLKRSMDKWRAITNGMET